MKCGELNGALETHGSFLFACRVAGAPPWSQEALSGPTSAAWACIFMYRSFSFFIAHRSLSFLALDLRIVHTRSHKQLADLSDTQTKVCFVSLDGCATRVLNRHHGSQLLAIQRRFASPLRVE